MIISTKNFNPESDIKLRCTCGHERCDRRSVSQEELDKVQLIRDEAKRGLVITSGGRCPYHPDEVKRTKPADHQNCVAVDIRVYSGVERMELVRLGLKHGANAIGVAKTFVHLGWRKDSAPVVWTY